MFVVSSWFRTDILTLVQLLPSRTHPTSTGLGYLMKWNNLDALLARVVAASDWLNTSRKLVAR